MENIRNHHYVLLIMILISGFMGLQLVFFLLHALFEINLSLGIVQYCVAAIKNQAVIHTVVNIALYLIILYSFSTVISIGFKQFLNNKRWNAFVRASQKVELTDQLNNKYKHLGQRVFVIHDESLIAVTSGFIRPKVILSSAVITQFTERELTAIILHEHSHCINYDPLRMLLVKMMTDSLPFIPLMRRLSHYISVWVELDADSYAVQYLKSPVELACALLKCSKMRQQMSVGVGFAKDSINYRLIQLIEPRKTIHVPCMYFGSLAISSLTIFFISMIIVSGCS